MAASIVGVSSLFSKPAESIAPILGWTILGFLSSPSADEDKTREGSNMQLVLFILLLIPIGCSTLQLLFWCRFSLRGEYLDEIKQRNAENEKLEDGDDSVKLAV
jgi:hypothetical protein